MSREGRKYGELGTYTIVLRSKGAFKSGQALFFDILNKQRNISNVKVLAYAINNNDAYLVLHEGELKISDLIKKITLSFVKQFKKRFKNFSTIFHGRYLSEELNSNEEVLDAIVKVNNLCEDKFSKDPFTTSREKYFKNSNIDSDIVKKNFGKRKFEKAHKIKFAPADAPLSIGKLTDAEVAEYIYLKYGIKASDVNKIKKSKLDKILLEIVESTRASARQISRITKLSLRYLWGLLKKKKGNVNA